MAFFSSSFLESNLMVWAAIGTFLFLVMWLTGLAIPNIASTKHSSSAMIIFASSRQSHYNEKFNLILPYQVWYIPHFQLTTDQIHSVLSHIECLRKSENTVVHMKWTISSEQKHRAKKNHYNNTWYVLLFFSGPKMFVTYMKKKKK